MAETTGRRFGGNGLFRNVREECAGRRAVLGGSAQESVGQVAPALRHLIGRRIGAAVLLMLPVCMAAACSDSSSEESRSFPAKETSWHSLAYGTDYMELEHGWLVRRVSALTFVPFPASWSAERSTGYAGQRYDAGEGGGGE
jgi:hypothetical protein